LVPGRKAKTLPHEKKLSPARTPPMAGDWGGRSRAAPDVNLVTGLAATKKTGAPGRFTSIPIPGRARARGVGGQHGADLGRPELGVAPRHSGQTRAKAARRPAHGEPDRFHVHEASARPGCVNRPGTKPDRDGRTATRLFGTPRSVQRPLDHPRTEPGTAPPWPAPTKGQSGPFRTLSISGPGNPVVPRVTP